MAFAWMGMGAVTLRAAAMVAALSLCAQTQTVPAGVTTLLADARAALGGDARLSAVRTFVIEGSIVRGSPRASAFGAFTITCALPDRFLQTTSVLSVSPQANLDTPAFNSFRDVTTLGFSGGRVIYQPTVPERRRGPDLRPATSAEVQTLLERAQRDFVGVTLGLFASSFASAPAQFAAAPGADALVVTINGSDVPLTFDPRTHLPLRFGDVVYGDYRSVGGLKAPFLFRVAPRGAIPEEWRVKTVRYNVELNDRTFRR